MKRSVSISHLGRPQSRPISRQPFVAFERIARPTRTSSQRSRGSRTAEAAGAGKDPVEGKSAPSAGPAQRLVRELIRG